MRFEQPMYGMSESLDAGSLRVLVVDDDPELLASLRQSLAEEGCPWELSFACGAAEALALLGAGDVDVMVSDLCRQASNGAALLEEARKLSPRTLRFVLSGDAPAEQALRAAPFCHQWIAQPSSLEELLQRVTSAMDAVESLRLKNAVELIGGLGRLPVAPEAYSELMRIIGSTTGELDDIAEWIARDPSLTGRILQMVNSAFFALPRRVVDVRDAVCVLGMQQVAQIVLSSELFQVWSESSPRVRTLALEGQSHALEVAALSVQIAKKEGLPSDACLAAGLLHDCGRLALGLSAPEMLDSAAKLALDQGMPAWAAEEALGGCSHASVGGALLGAWGLPSEIVRAVAFHHQPLRSGSSEFDLVGVVHVASALVDGRRPDPDYVREMGIVDRIPVWEALLAGSEEEAA